MPTCSFVNLAGVSLVILALLASACSPQSPGPAPAPTQAYWPNGGWLTSTPENQGFDSAQLNAGLQAFQQEKVKINSLLIIRNGRLLLDACFYPYDCTAVHDMASVTKSVMTTLIAIAADQGKLQLDQPMISYFPGRTIANLDPRKEHITVRHLAGMVNGFESRCVSGDEAELNAMRAAPDWVRAALDRKMRQEPGANFCYDSPGMHLLSAILQETTGMTAFDFARQVLFEPLGITQVTWDSDPQGYTRGWGDLHLKPQDAARLGYLWLNGGVWDGRQIVPAAWVKDAVQVHSQTGMSDDYGYGWWVSQDSYAAMGGGGQTIKVYPSYHAVVVTTGQDFDFARLDPILAAAFIDPDDPLPDNPSAVTHLKETLAGLLQAPPPRPVGVLPDTAAAISDLTYRFTRNRLRVETLRLAFDDSAQAILHIQRTGEKELLAWPVGLDGNYRLSLGDSQAAQALRGSWVDPETFLLELNYLDNRDVLILRLHFDGPRLTIDSPASGETIVGQAD
jgi:CubicO group peptidase (beta-lactamase class C family)